VIDLHLKYKKLIKMKKLITTSLIIMIAISSAFTQGKPLRGSGNIKELTYTKGGFDKLNVLDFEGKITVKIGKPHNVQIKIDDNIAELVEFSLDEAENELTIRVKNNKNGRLYLEDINSHILIMMPEASVIKHRGNSNMSVEGLIGRYFRMDQQGNGDVRLFGSIDELDISKLGNGGVFAEKLFCKTANINSIGNGNVKIDASDSFFAKGVGNGDVIQVGKGVSKAFSTIIGNGDIIKKSN
jgi:hypothetical protein